MPANDTILTVVGLGEILWDTLPAGKQLGGAPTNFSYMSSLLGDRGIVASRIGTDPPGNEIAVTLSQLGVPAQYLQRDEQHPTGTVEVEVGGDGQPRFSIQERVAWDFLEWTPEWQSLATAADVVCFGTLAQRSAASRATIERFVRAARSGTLRVFDVNLRAPFYTAGVIAASLQMATVVKLNHEELPLLAGMLGFPRDGEEASARRLLQAYGLAMVCVTRGARGSLLVDARSSSEHPGFQVRVADTVGAGDAFTACLAHHLARGAPLDEINTAANRFAAWVASRAGGTPALGARSLQQELSEVGS